MGEYVHGIFTSQAAKDLEPRLREKKVTVPLNLGT
jgi:hypothetical protein